MKKLEELKREDVEDIEFLLTDIDDTLTKDGKLLPEAYTGIWDVTEAGIAVIPVTGRSAGWCDMIMTQWPVRAVIGENGAFAFIHQGDTYRIVYHPSTGGDQEGEKLRKIEAEVVKKIKGAKPARDQFSRLFDLAIDYAETEPFLSLEQASEIQKISESFGASAKISSIHVNIWFGDYDKLSMAKHLFFRQWNLDEERIVQKVIFCGDSPNDEPMFRYFPLSIGVGNISKYLDYIHTPPSFITEQLYGAGFAELSKRIIYLKNL